MNSQGIVAQTFRADPESTDPNSVGVQIGKLVNVENLSETTIEWRVLNNDSRHIADEWRVRRKYLSINNNNDIVLIDSGTRKNTRDFIYYSLGKVMVDANGFPTDVHWDEERVRIVPDGPVPGGVNVQAAGASVAINNEGDVLVVYDNGGESSQLWAHVGAIQEDGDTGIRTIQWHNEYPKAIPTTTKFLDGIKPAIDLNDDRRVLINHRGNNSEYVWLASGYLTQQNTLSVDYWERLSRIAGGARKLSMSYKLNGISFVDRASGENNSMDDPYQFILFFSKGNTSGAHLRYHMGTVFPIDSALNIKPETYFLLPDNVAVL